MTTQSTFEFRFAFRIVGPCWRPRRLVDASRAFAGYAACDPAAHCDQEAYLSAFCFGDAFRQHLAATGSTAGYSGPCWAPYLWFDVDRADLRDALRDARRLAAVLDARFGFGDGDLICFFSGSKGFHLGLRTALWSPAPGPAFHQVARRFCERLAEAAQIEIDSGVYDRVRAFRAPNSRHPKTGLYKVLLDPDELLRCSLDSILAKAQRPYPFELLPASCASDQALADWRAAVELVEREATAKAAVRAAAVETPRLNRATLDFIRNGAAVGDRHRLLYSAAANLAEFGCPPALAHALLSEAALDSGLPPKEVRRQIECGLAAGRNV